MLQKQDPDHLPAAPTAKGSEALRRPAEHPVRARFCDQVRQLPDRSNVWAKMKRLCAAANVESHKVYPHNLRKLFARTFYTMEKDIALLADILGHGSIETTRIYIMSTGKEHRQKIEHLNLLM